MSRDWIGLDFWCLTPLSTISQLYRGDHVETATVISQIANTFHIINKCRIVFVVYVLQDTRCLLDPASLA